jgi:chromosome segregation ATPase
VKALRRADEQGYSRARGQFEGEIAALRDALKAERGLSFYAHIESLLQSRALQSKTYVFSTWRQWVYGITGLEEAERQKKVIAQLRDQLAASEGQSGAYLSKLSAVEKELRALRDEKRVIEDEYFNKVRDLRRDLEQLQREKEHQLEKLQLDNQMLQTRLDQSKSERAHLEEEHLSAIARERKGREQLIADKQDLEQERDQAQAQERSLRQKNKDLTSQYATQIDDLNTALTRTQNQEKTTRRDNEVFSETLKQVHTELAESKANVRTLEARIREQGAEIEQYVAEQKKVMMRLKHADEALEAANKQAPRGSGGNLGAHARGVRDLQE